MKSVVAGARSNLPGDDLPASVEQQLDIGRKNGIAKAAGSPAEAAARVEKQELSTLLLGLADRLSSLAEGLAG